MRNKLFPISMRAFTMEDEAEFVRKYGLSLIDAEKWSGADISTSKMSPAPKSTEFQSSKDKHPPQIDVYNYTADEISGYTELYSTMKQWAHQEIIKSNGLRKAITVCK